MYEYYVFFSHCGVIIMGLVQRTAIDREGKDEQELRDDLQMMVDQGHRGEGLWFKSLAHRLRVVPVRSFEVRKKTEHIESRLLLQ